MPVKLNGSTSGFVQLAAPAVAGSTSLVLPTDSVQPGMVLVATSSFSAAATVSVDNCFTSTYQRYLLASTHLGSAAAVINLRMRSGGSDNTAASYAWQQFNDDNATTSGSRATAQTAFAINTLSTGSRDSFEFWITSPFESVNTLGVGLINAAENTVRLWRFGLRHVSTTSFDGFTLYPASGTITGELRVYGLRNSITT